MIYPFNRFLPIIIINSGFLLCKTCHLELYGICHVCLKIFQKLTRRCISSTFDFQFHPIIFLSYSFSLLQLCNVLSISSNMILPFLEGKFFFFSLLLMFFLEFSKPKCCMQLSDSDNISSYTVLSSSLLRVVELQKF